MEYELGLRPYDWDDARAEISAMHAQVRYVDTTAVMFDLSDKIGTYKEQA